MLFNSLSYAIFLPIVFILYWLLPRTRWQNIFLLAASYTFYAIGDWRFLGVLVGMSLLSWIIGRYYAKVFAGGGMAHSRYMWLAVVVDLLILGFFKYYNFFAESFANLFGANPDSVMLKLVLPLGISFFTFQAISYVVDAYRGQSSIINQQSSIESMITCFLYIGFFPKLLAGPIERPSNLIPQIQQKRVFEYDLAVDGCRQILWGLFKKVVVADGCAMVVDKAWGDLGSQSGSTLVLIAVLYTIQIYGDFSGYSDMAIGSAKLLGFRFRDNFLFPYFSRNMGEFWKRWHISLNTWFVDYVYIPLGGDGRQLNGKCNMENVKCRTSFLKIRNTMIIFLLSGLWHGADWSFVAWGGYHGLLLVLLILLGWNTRYDEVVAAKHWYPSLKEIGQILLVFALATFGWILFRAPSIEVAWWYLTSLCGNGLFSTPWLINRAFYIPTFSAIVLMALVDWSYRNRVEDILKMRAPRIINWLVYLMLSVWVIYSWSLQQESHFIYSAF